MIFKVPKTAEAEFVCSCGREFFFLYEVASHEALGSSHIILSREDDRMLKERERIADDEGEIQ